MTMIILEGVMGKTIMGSSFGKHGPFLYCKEIGDTLNVVVFSQNGPFQS